MVQRELRNYEVSIWSLQDDFITVLKYSDIEHKGQTQDGELISNVDGTQELSFKIPMYLFRDGQKIENPVWYNYTSGIIVANMRKIKVIINKMTEDEEIYELIITNVNENHEDEELYCEVQCEGLAFHELGKTGYKISLNAEDFYADDLDYFENGAWIDSRGNRITAMPKANIQYWLNKFLIPYPENETINPRVWYYQIQMDWTDFTRYNESKELVTRDTDKIYEDEYVSSWQNINGNLVPKDWIGYREKERLVTLEESNKYNLTQDLAENFGVYCRYEYEHDDNYRITGRKVIFYNSFLEESKGAIDITYKYNTSSISREMDSTELVTKMYVRPVDSENSASGYITIMDVEANKSREDYLLNFDYMYSIGAISKESYDEIEEYEKNIRECNLALIPIQEKLVELQFKKPEVAAKVQFYKNAAQLDQERLNNSQDLLNNLTNNTGVIEVSDSNPKTGVLIKNTDGVEGSYYLKITERGIDISTLKVYKDINFAASPRLTNEIHTWSAEYDEFGEITRLINIYAEELDKKTVYLTYSYSPKLYYEKVRDIWETRLNKDTELGEAAQDELTNIETEINSLEANQQEKLVEKKELIEDFENMMGAALREGFWQPEDYTDYGDVYTSFITLSNNTDEINGTGSFDSFIWDEVPFDGEQKITYEIGAQQTIKYYPLLKLINDDEDLDENDKYNYLSNIKDHLDNLNLLFYNYEVETEEEQEESRPANERRVFALGSQCQLGFIKDNTNKIIPVLIITGVESLSDSEIEYITNPETGKATLGYLTTRLDDDENTATKILKTEEHSYLESGKLAWIINGGIVEEEEEEETEEVNESPYTPVYPRLKINTLSLKTSEDQLALKYNNTNLKNYEDYYILSRTANETSYYITLKPEVLVRKGILTGQLGVRYTVSNANTAIYLDAIQVLKDSAYPQVSYDLNVELVQKDYIKKVAKLLNRIVHINDYELKFKNVQGYVSQVTLNLDKPWEDKIEIKNYKTKFEDLFTKIVATTEQMKKNEYVSGVVSQIYSNGQLDTDTLQEGLNNVNLTYSFNDGNLIIDEQNGIVGTSDNGVVAMKNGGIFTANDKDDNGDWKWNTAITPSGINADLITAGQLDTNRIRIFAGDDLKFQLNADGIYAYKSFFNDLNIVSSEETLPTNIINTIQAKVDENKRNNINDDLDASQYVVLNPNGLFLIAKDGALVLNEDKTDYITIDENECDRRYPLENGELKRVSITWDGLTLRNYKNVPTFYADADTGDLILKGTVYANAGEFTGSIKATSFELSNGVEIVQGNNTYNLSTFNDATNSINSFTENGLSTQYPWNGHYYSVALTDAVNSTEHDGSTRELASGLLIGSNSGITIVAPDPYGTDLTSSTAVKIDASGIKIGSNGTFTLNTSNFKINPSDVATDENPIFYVGDSENYIKYTSEGLAVNLPVSLSEEAIESIQMGVNTGIYKAISESDLYNNYANVPNGSLGIVYKNEVEQQISSLFFERPDTTYGTNRNWTLYYNSIGYAAASGRGKKTLFGLFKYWNVDYSVSENKGADHGGNTYARVGYTDSSQTDSAILLYTIGEDDDSLKQGGRAGENITLTFNYKFSIGSTWNVWTDFTRNAGITIALIAGNKKKTDLDNPQPPLNSAQDVINTEIAKDNNGTLSYTDYVARTTWKAPNPSNTTGSFPESISLPIIKDFDDKTILYLIMYATNSYTTIYISPSSIRMSYSGGTISEDDSRYGLYLKTVLSGTTSTWVPLVTGGTAPSGS